MCRMPPLTLDPQIPCFLLEASIDRLLHRGVPQQTSKFFVLQLHIDDVVIYDLSASGQKYVLDEPAACHIWRWGWPKNWIENRINSVDSVVFCSGIK